MSLDVSIFVKIEKIGCRAVIKYSNLKSHTLAQMKAELDAAHKDSAPLFDTVKIWVVK